jgi:hypothetical protein
MAFANSTNFYNITIEDIENSTDANPKNFSVNFGDNYLVLLTLLIIALAIILLLLVECTRKADYFEYVTRDGKVLSIPRSMKKDEYDAFEEEMLAVLYTKNNHSKIKSTIQQI